MHVLCRGVGAEVGKPAKGKGGRLSSQLTSFGLQEGLDCRLERSAENPIGWAGARDGQRSINKTLSFETLRLNCLIQGRDCDVNLGAKV